MSDTQLYVLVGAIIGGICLLVLCVATMCLLRQRRRRSSQPSDHTIRPTSMAQFGSIASDSTKLNVSDVYELNSANSSARASTVTDTDAVDKSYQYEEFFPERENDLSHYMRLDQLRQLQSEL